MSKKATTTSIALCIAAWASPAAADLSYTFVDFRVLSNAVDAAGERSPAPLQDVAADAGDGDGISVAGSVGLPAGFYLTGGFNSSVIDVTTTITSPLTEQRIQDEFDLISSSFGVGYQRELAENFDAIVELAYDSAEFDFGSLAGEDFDVDDGGAAARVGFRWNPREPFELYTLVGSSPVGEVDLDAGTFDSATVVNAGVRWYFFPDLGVGVDYQSGDLSAVTLSMRFSFGTLPW